MPIATTMYLCAFCDKPYVLKGSCRSHERHCRENPERIPYEGQTRDGEIFHAGQWIFVGRDITESLVSHKVYLGWRWNCVVRVMNSRGKNTSVSHMMLPDPANYE